MKDLVIEERLKYVSRLSLKKGSHTPIGTLPPEDMCAMEAVSYVTGEEWGHRPICVSPIIGQLMVSWNDDLRIDEYRNRLLKPLIPVIVGTRGSSELEEAREQMGARWIKDVFLSEWSKLAASELTGEILNKDVHGVTIRHADCRKYSQRYSTGKCLFKGCCG